MKGSRVTTEEPYSVSHLIKPDILRGHGSFAKVLSGGHSITCGQLRCFYLVLEKSGSAVKAGFTVTRNIKNAVRRNRSKRLMREAWKMHSESIRKKAMNSEAEIQLLFFSRDPGENKVPHYRQFNDSMKELLEKLNERLGN